MIQGVEEVSAELEKRINSAKIDVPMLPETANKVIILSQDSDSDAAQLAQLIQSDQSLAGHVMRIANSAAYTPNNSMVSLQQAIARLGINLISEIALAASISSKMFKAPGFEDYLDKTWRHALATALWSKEVARVGRRNVEANFLCGLLHSIGRPVALQECINIGDKLSLALPQKNLLALVENYQQTTGLTVVEKWGMPKIVCDVIRSLDQHNHKLDHQPDNSTININTNKTTNTSKSSASNTLEQTASVLCGIQFASHMLEPDTLTLKQLSEDPILSEVNLYQDEVTLLLDKQDVIRSTMESMLS